jgi:ribosome-associated protein
MHFPLSTFHHCLPGFPLYLPCVQERNQHFELIMPRISIKDRDFSSELHFTATRSSGPGGQNVNKVNTRVELRFVIIASSLLSEEEKSLILAKLEKKINSEGELIIVSQSERSQLKNKEKAIEKFYSLLSQASTPRKKRKPTSPSPASIEERLESKRKQSEKKVRRRNL